MVHSDTPESDPTADIDIDAELARLLEPEQEMLQVVLMVPNGLEHAGQAVFVPMGYHVTPTTLMHAQALLERGSAVNVPAAVSRASAAIAAIVGDAAVAEQVAAHLAELDLLK